MITNLLEKITGKDDLERVAHKEDLAQLNAYLKTRRVFVPRRPKAFLDAANFSQQQLMELIQKETRDLANEPFEPWILELDGKKRLPVFSSQKKLQEFAKTISTQLNKVIPVGSGEILLESLTKNSDIDFVDLNLFCNKSWEIGLKPR